MVAKRQCSFCAEEIEPGTGTMFVKRDGTVFQFCSSSCRKQQLRLGRLGHRLKWTRAYSLKKAAERSSAGRLAAARPAPAAVRASPKPPAAPSEPPATAAAAVPAAPPKAPAKSGAKGPARAPTKPAAKSAPKAAAKPATKAEPKPDADAAEPDA